jgi:hypothetical protein
MYNSFFDIITNPLSFPSNWMVLFKNKNDTRRVFSKQPYYTFCKLGNAHIFSLVQNKNLLKVINITPDTEMYFCRENTPPIACKIMGLKYDMYSPVYIIFLPIYFINKINVGTNEKNPELMSSIELFKKSEEVLAKA